MVKKIEMINNCKFKSKALVKTANFYASFYVFCVFLPLIVSLISISSNFDIPVYLSIFVAFVGVIPFIFMGSISKIQKYRDVSKDFENLSIDFDLKKYKKINKESSKLLINIFVNMCFQKKKFMKSL